MGADRMTTPLSPSQRQQRHRARGFVVSATLLDPDAISALESLRAVRGDSIREVIEAALILAARRKGRAFRGP